jgi:hypothetical protein
MVGAEMARSFLVLDLETIVDADLPSPDAAALEGGIAPPYHQKPVVFGVLWLDESYACKRIGLLGEGKDEPEMLRDFGDFLERYGPDLVTWDGRRFDLPVLLFRALRHGVTLGRYYARGDYRYRYTPEGHLDLCDFLAEHGASYAPTLDVAARLIGLPGKVGALGRMVAPLVEQGRLAEVQRACLCDVVQTAFLFLRAQLLRGILDLAGYRKAAEALHRALRDEPRLHAIWSAPDLALDRLLLRSG